MWLWLPFHLFMVVVTGLFGLFPDSSYAPLNLPSQVNDAVGTLGGIALWAVELTGDDISAALAAALGTVIVIEIAVVSVRVLLRMAVFGIGLRFARSFLAKNYVGAGEAGNH